MIIIIFKCISYAINPPLRSKPMLFLELFSPSPKPLMMLSCNVDLYDGVRVESRRYSARLKRISRWAAVRRPGLTLTASTHITAFEKSQWTINLAVLSLESDHRGLNSYILVEDNLVLYLLYLSECSPAGRPRLTRSLGLIRLVLTVDKWLEKTSGLYL